MAFDLDDVLHKFVPKQLYDELRRDYDRLLVRVGRMEEQLLMLSDYRLEPEEPTDVIDRKIRSAQRGGHRRVRDTARAQEPEEEHREEPRRPAEREGERRRPRETRKSPFERELDESLAEESTEELIRRLRERYREINRLRDRLREEEE